MGWVQVLSKVIAYLPAIIQGVEGFFGKGNGKTKHENVNEVTNLALNITNAIANNDIVDVDEFNAGKDDLIKAIVRIFNASIWHKSKVNL